MGVGRPLFETEQGEGRGAYKLYAASVGVGVCFIWWYRAANVPAGTGEGAWAWACWAGMLAAELLFGFYWFITQSVRWKPVTRRTHKDRLARRYGADLPGIDIFVCTADPIEEPPALVVSTVLSVMAYDYLPEKLSIYLSDDAGSFLTFYALWEASNFAKHWLPFCKRFNVEPRSPAAYFSKSYDSLNKCDLSEWSIVKTLYQEMVGRINSVVTQGRIPEELVHNRGFSEWNLGMTSRDHPPIVQIFTDAKGKSLVDMDGNVLPTLVYMAREKRPQYHHNFKAGAMNALLYQLAHNLTAPVKEYWNVESGFGYWNPSFYFNVDDGLVEQLISLLIRLQMVQLQEGHDRRVWCLIGSQIFSLLIPCTNFWYLGRVSFPITKII